MRAGRSGAQAARQRGDRQQPGHGERRRATPFEAVREVAEHVVPFIQSNPRYDEEAIMEELGRVVRDRELSILRHGQVFDL